MDGWQVETGGGRIAQPMRAGFARVNWGARIADIALFLVLASSFYQTSEQGKDQPVPYDLLLVGSMALFFALGLRFPRRLALPASLWGLIIVGYGIGGMGAVYLDRLQNSLPVTAYLTCAFIFFASCVFEAPERRLSLLFNAYCVAAILAAAAGVGGYFGIFPDSFGFTNFGRADGTFNDPNVFGPYLIAPTLYLGLRLTKARALHAFGLLPLFALLVLAILLSFSRGAWGSFLLSSLVFGGFTLATSRSPAQSTRLIAFSALMGLIIVAVVGVALSTPKVQRLFEERASLVQDYDVGHQGRFDSQKRAIAMALEHPLGIGPAQWAMINKLDTHNVYLHVLVAGGFLAGLAFLSFVGLTVIRGWRAVLIDAPGRELLIVVFAAVIGHVAEGLIIDIDNWRHLFLLFGMLWGGILAAEARRGPRAAHRVGHDATASLKRGGAVEGFAA
ncbi:MAG: O-antigen ligase family protein [Parvibaculum sp.]|uniref:O-antigen ligase family protein n=1 Tax=Parvibaculum sp. TaxID=2024848 RepID=UPI003C72A02D